MMVAHKCLSLICISIYTCVFSGLIKYANKPNTPVATYTIKSRTEEKIKADSVSKLILRKIYTNNASLVPIPAIDIGIIDTNDEEATIFVYLLRHEAVFE